MEKHVRMELESSYSASPSREKRHKTGISWEIIYSCTCPCSSAIPDDLVRFAHRTVSERNKWMPTHTGSCSTQFCGGETKPPTLAHRFLSVDKNHSLSLLPILAGNRSDHSFEWILRTVRRTFCFGLSRWLRVFAGRGRHQTRSCFRDDNISECVISSYGRVWQ